VGETLCTYVNPPMSPAIDNNAVRCGMCGTTFGDGKSDKNCCVSSVVDRLRYLKVPLGMYTSIAQARGMDPTFVGGYIT
jgi:hypothetical protein